MNNVLREPIENYLIEKSKAFGKNWLANKFRKEFPSQITELIPDKTRYKVVGSSGKGNWTECPWIAILDILITNSPQKGYYPVFIYKSDMSGIYLSLNQGVTDVIENYKKEAISVLKLRAKDYRAKINYNDNDYLTKINLSSNIRNAKHYEAGNIIAKYYPRENLPNASQLKNDIYEILELYENLTYIDNSFNDRLDIHGIEKKKVRLHERIERNSYLSKKVKKIKGYNCEACKMTFTEVYGNIGENFIETHHLKPISELGIGNFKVNLKEDFAVLCSNCHRMIHKLEDPSDLEKLKKIIEQIAK